nr:hypothetical protein [Calliblepharis sp.]
MSHLSRIKTSISNKEILQKTLLDLNFNYEKTNTIHNNNKDIIVQKNGKNLFTFSWDGKEYLLLADLQLWKSNMTCTRLINKIIQQYSYNTIIKESTKYGFTNINQKILRDGSIQLIIQRWH